LFASYFLQRFPTGADSFSINVNSAGAAVLDSTAVFGACKFEMISQNPEQGGFWINVQLVGLAVYSQFDHDSSVEICP
jgi:hypothetical protein